MRERLFGVPKGLFAYGGLAGVGMRQLAARATSVSPRSFITIPTRLERYAGVLDRVLGRIEQGFGRNARAGGSADEQLEC